MHFCPGREQTLESPICQSNNDQILKAMVKTYYNEQEYKITNSQGVEISFRNAIEYVQYLRRVQKCVDPVIFTSFYSCTYLIQQSNTKILSAIGHNFLRIPFSVKDLEDMSKEMLPLNDIQLSDISINYCQLKSAIREGFHRFKGRIREIKGRKISENDKIKLFNHEFEQYESELIREVKEYPDILMEFKRIVSLFDPRDISSIEKIETIQEENFSCYLPEDNDYNEIMATSTYGWEVLFLDDKPNELEEIFRVLEERGIKYQVATSSVAAKQIIERDFYNRISVVVSDYRLFEDQNQANEIQRMQSEQGYDFLVWLSRQNRYNGMIALSGLSKWFLLDSFRKNKINVKVYSKSGLLGGGVKLFIDDLEHLGTQFVEVLHNQPKASLWTEPQYKSANSGVIKCYPFKPYYIYHRNNTEYLTHEDDINKMAEKVARELEFALDKSSNFDFLSLSSIQGELTKTLKGKYDCEYNDFRRKLLQRRVFYYLLIKGIDRDAIVKMLHKGEWDADITQMTIKAVMNMLAIQSTTDIPHNLLVEEKFFLHHYMGIPIYNMAELMDQTYVLINTILTDYFSDNEKLYNKLRNYCVEQDGLISVGTVSMSDMHVLVKKVVDELHKLNKFAESIHLIDDIANVFKKLQDIVPNKTLLKNSIRALVYLKEIAVKERFR